MADMHRKDLDVAQQGLVENRRDRLEQLAAWGDSGNDNSRSAFACECGQGNVRKYTTRSVQPHSEKPPDSLPETRVFS